MTIAHTASVQVRLQQVMDMMDTLIADNSIPKKIRATVADAKERLKGDEEPVVRAGSAMYLLDTISTDINVPMHARTQIWTIVSALENIRSE